MRWIPRDEHLTAHEEHVERGCVAASVEADRQRALSLRIGWQKFCAVITEIAREATMSEPQKWERPELRAEAVPGSMYWYLHMSGGFVKHLAETICRADDDNLDRLRLAFPQMVEAWEMHSWKTAPSGFEPKYNADAPLSLKETANLLGADSVETVGDIRLDPLGMKALATKVGGAPSGEPTLQKQIEQLRVQLAGCSVAALGQTKVGIAKKGDYGWSVTYQDVLELRLKYDDCVAKPKEHTAEDAPPERRLKDEFSRRGNLIYKRGRDGKIPYYVGPVGSPQVADCYEDALGGENGNPA